MKRSLTFALFTLLICAHRAHAQTSGSSNTPFEVIDNSFLVEEAFNQDPGVFQNIFTWSRDRRGAWDMGFTQEWPLGGMTHQFSYTLPVSGGNNASAHVGGVLLNYRYQLMEEGRGRPAIAPRVSVILPTGTSADDSDRTGLQTNVAFSKQHRDLYFHWNAGFTWIHGVPVTSEDDRSNTLSPQLAASIVWRTAPMVQLMLENVVQFQQSVNPAARLTRDRFVTISPGFRRGWNIGERQVVVGAAVPVTIGNGDRTTAILLYGSYELPFK